MGGGGGVLRVSWGWYSGWVCDRVGSPTFFLCILYSFVFAIACTGIIKHSDGATRSSNSQSIQADCHSEHECLPPADS